LRDGKGVYYAPRIIQVGDQYNYCSQVPDPRKYDIFVAFDTTYYYTGVQWLGIDMDKDKTNELQTIDTFQIYDTNKIRISLEGDGEAYKTLTLPSQISDSLQYDVSKDSLFLRDGEGSYRPARIISSDSVPRKEWMDGLIGLRKYDIWFDRDGGDVIPGIYYWDGDEWKTISDDIDNTNELQDLSLDSLNRVFSLGLTNGGTVKWKDIDTNTNPKDSTTVVNAYGTIITETPANQFNITVDSSKFATQDDLSNIVSDVAYSGTWDGVTTIAPSKNAIYDKITSLEPINFSPTSITVNYGTLNQGAYTDLAAVGGTDVIIQERVANPPFQVTIGFTGVARISGLKFYGRYNGSASHNVHIEAYNYITAAWDYVGEISTTTNKQWFSYNLNLPNNYLSSGNAEWRIIHEGSGNITHQLIIDYANVNYGGGGGSGFITAGAVEFTPTGNISATNVQAAIEELDTEKFDSTTVVNSYGTIINESPANQFNIKVDSSMLATQYDLMASTFWTKNSNAIYPKSTSYEVAIGQQTNDPDGALDVAGKTKTTTLQMTTGAGASKILTSDASGNASWETHTDNNTTYSAGYGLGLTGTTFYNSRYWKNQDTVKTTLTGLLKATSGVLSAASAGTDYQAPITNPVTGTGTTNYITKFTGASTIGNSIIRDDGTYVGIGVAPGTYKLNVNGRTKTDQLTYTKSIDISSLNANDITDAGFYSGDGVTNAPANGWHYYTVQRYVNSADYVCQIATDLTTNTNTWIRTRKGGTWGSWYKFWTTENAASVVSGSGTANQMTYFTGTSTISSGTYITRNATTNDLMVHGMNIGKGASTVLSNMALGTATLNANTTGSYNIALGYVALNKNTEGSYNMALSPFALYNNITGSDNIALGYFALGNNINSNNVAIGTSALYNNTSGSQNMGIGAYSLYANTTASNNVINIHYIGDADFPFCTVCRIFHILC